MRRRALLTTLAACSAGVAGCSLGSGSDTPATEPNRTADESQRDETPTEFRDGDLNWPDDRASVVELETVPRTYALSPTQFPTDDEARVRLRFDRTATADHPARVTGWLENANDFENTFQVRWIPAVGQVHSRQPSGYDHEASLHLVPTENNEIATAAPTVERNDDGSWYVTDAGSWMPDYHRLAPGERVRLEYVLVGEEGSPGRPTGTYEFSGRDQNVTVTVWDTASPGPTDASRFQGRSVPEIDGSTTVQWYHEADRETAAFVRPSTERLELDGLVEFEMVNNSHEATECGHWDLYKLVDGEWFHVGPNVHTLACGILHQGGRKDWSLRAFNGESVPCGSGCNGGFTREYLGGGEYAVVVGYGNPTDESAALVDLVGDQVSVVQTDDAAAERDGDAVTVEMPPSGEGGQVTDATLILEGTDEADERLIAEQVMGRQEFGPGLTGLRNSLPFLGSGVERVVVRTDERVVDRAVGYDETVRRFEFRGQAYEARRGDGES